MPRAAAIAAVVASFVGCDAGRGTHPAVGLVMRPLPIVALERPDAGRPRLEGRITLLNFWGTWCPPCRLELPGLARIAKRLEDEPAFQFVPVACGAGDLAETAADTRAFLSERRLAIENWGFADPVARGIFSAAYGLEAFPTTYLIGPDAVVRRVWVGYRSSDEADVARSIVELLKEAVPSSTVSGPAESGSR